jgi:hypothetical protein
MSDLLELPLTLYQGRHNTPHNQPISWKQSPLPLNDPPISRPSRCRQTPRVIREILAQCTQLVPQDVTTQCNALEAHQSHSNDEIKCASEWVVFLQLTKGLLKCMGFQECSQGRPPSLFIATQVNRVVEPLELSSARSPEGAVPASDNGGGAPTIEYQRLVGFPSTRQ